MRKRLPVALRKLVQERAQGRCEYCLLHEEDAVFPHVVDHVVARKHRGLTEADNLSWSCVVCNGFKGSDLASIDIETGQMVRLFNPRQDTWSRHFQLNGPLIVPLTSEGRVTANLLQFNRTERVQRRLYLIEAGRYPR